MTSEEFLLNIGSRLAALEALMASVAAITFDNVHPDMRGKVLKICAQRVMERTDLNQATRLATIDQIAELLALPPPVQYRS